MSIMAKGILESIELDSEEVTIKGISTFFIKRRFPFDTYTFAVKKYKLPGRLSSGKLVLEVRKKFFSMKIVFNFGQKEQYRFDDIVKILQYGVADANVVYSASGVDGLVELYKEKVVIKRDANSSLGFWVHGLKGNKEIFLKSISAIQFKSAGTVMRGFVKGTTHNGYIQFTISGGNEARGGILNASGDENTVFFTKEQEINFIKIKDLINDKNNGVLIEQSNEDKSPMENDGRRENDNSEESIDLAYLEKLAELKSKGIITEEEFISKKRKILKL